MDFRTQTSTETGQRECIGQVALGLPMRRTVAIVGIITLLALTSLMAGAPRSTAAPSPSGGAPLSVKLRDCWMTVALVPRPAPDLQAALSWQVNPPTFFGQTDPFLAVWALNCDQARVAGKRARDVIVSLVGVPISIDEEAPSAVGANYFGHALIAIDTDASVVAKALRRAGLRVDVARRASYDHSPQGETPYMGNLTLPGEYMLDVVAGTPDPFGEHMHRNTFEYRPRRGPPVVLELSIEQANDNVCIPADEPGCTASLEAPEGSALGEVLGGSSAPVMVGLDHAKISRIDLTVT